MGGAVSAESIALSRESCRLYDAAEREEDARAASLRTNVIATTIALAVALGPSRLGRAAVFGAVTSRQAVALAMIAWTLFSCRVLLLRVLGTSHPASRLFGALDELGRHGAPLALIYFSGSATSPLWIATMCRGLAFPASTPSRARRDLGLFVLSHVAMLVALLVARRFADGAFTVLVLLGGLAINSLIARTIAARFRMRAERNALAERLHEASLTDERDRIARELHDGVAADVTALLMRLRTRARDNAHPKAAELLLRAQTILDDLRGVVWSLRTEQGTLGELGKLIDAASRAVRGPRAYVREMDAAQRTMPVGPRAVLSAIGVTRELVRLAGSRGGDEVVRIRLRVDDALRIEVHDERGKLGKEDEPDDLAHARDLLGEGGALTRAGGTVSLTIPLDATMRT